MIECDYHWIIQEKKEDVMSIDHLLNVFVQSVADLMSSVFREAMLVRAMALLCRWSDLTFMTKFDQPSVEKIENILEAVMGESGVRSTIEQFSLVVMVPVC